MFCRDPVQRKTWATVMVVEALNKEGIAMAERIVKFVAFEVVPLAGLGRKVVLTGFVRGFDRIPEAPASTEEQSHINGAEEVV